jgi:hypothetical protein
LSSKNEAVKIIHELAVETRKLLKKPEKLEDDGREHDPTDDIPAHEENTRDYLPDSSEA